MVNLIYAQGFDLELLLTANLYFYQRYISTASELYIILFNDFYFSIIDGLQNFFLSYQVLNLMAQSQDIFAPSITVWLPKAGRV